MRNVNIFIGKSFIEPNLSCCSKIWLFLWSFVQKKTLMSSVFPSFLISLLMDCQNISVFTITQTSFVKWECKVKAGNRMTYTLNIIRIQILNGLKCLLASILAQGYLDPFFQNKKWRVGVRKKNQINNCMICYSSEANIKKVAMAVRNMIKNKMMFYKASVN